MAAEQAENLSFTKPKKLPPLPHRTKVTKRPLIHPAIVPPRTGARVPKVVYISASSPFVSVIKRTRKFLNEIDKRSTSSKTLFGSSSLNDRQKLTNLGKMDEGRKEEVLLKGTGKAIQKVLQVALYFQEQEDCMVRIRTGSVGAVDDIETAEGEESRVRRTSMIEVAVSLR